MTARTSSSPIAMHVLALFITLWVTLSHSMVTCLTLKASPPSRSSQKGDDTPKALLILGMGRVGRLVAEQATPHFDVIYGTKRIREHDNDDDDDDNVTVTTTTTTTNKEPLSQTKMIREIAFSDEAIASALASCSCTHVLITTPPIQQPQQQQHDEDNDNLDASSPFAETRLPFTQILQGHVAGTAWIGVVSTTGVYGHHHGEWVTETSPCLCPAGSNADMYLKWENAWRQWSRENKALCRIFRCSGIYGSSRSSLHTLYKRGLGSSTTSSSGGAREDKAENVNDSESNASTKGTGGIKALSITNRIHEIDLTAAILASMLLHNKQTESLSSSACSDFEIYNLSDNLPESREVVFDYAKQLFASQGIDLPKRPHRTPSTSTTTATTAKSKRSVRRGREMKRVCNQKMKEHLLPKLFFPSYKQGMAHILEQQDQPWFSA